MTFARHLNAFALWAAAVAGAKQPGVHMPSLPLLLPMYQCSCRQGCPLSPWCCERAHDWCRHPTGPAATRCAHLTDALCAAAALQMRAKRQAAADGVPVPMGLNYGFPLSLPERQYEALKTGMRWY